MIPLLSRAEVRAFDRDAITRLGVPGLLLMENAGAHAARALRARFPDRLTHVLVLGGAGQNGGDAWVLARHLLAAGHAPRCMLVGDANKLSGDARVNFEALRALGVSIELAPPPAAVAHAARSASLIVDGLFGTGLDRPLAGALLEVVEAINAAQLPVLALDLPSGVDADTGQVLGAAVRASLTLTFAAHKPGLHQHPGAACAGELQCVDIGVPGPVAGVRGLIEARDVAALLPRRPPDAHKGSSGHVLAIAGSAGKTGAALLAATGALRAGAGLVTIASDPETRRALDHKVLELMTAEFPAEGALAALLELARGKAAALLGPGFVGVHPEARALARELALALPLPTVIDADALTALAGDLGALRAASGSRVLTPHPGEASRLLGRSTIAVQYDRLGAARELAAASAQVVVLKGARTVIAAPDGALRISRSGTPALGTAGTGDVLSGIIAALLVELSAFDAALCGVELHARAGELVAHGDRGLLAHEVADAFARALEQVRADALR